MKLEYTTDICGNEILQDETGQHQVMMAWEKPYMEKCIEYLEPHGSVLEIGFGLGYSANKLCSYETLSNIPPSLKTSSHRPLIMFTFKSGRFLFISSLKDSNLLHTSGQHSTTVYSDTVS